jgi:hypothetical protein
MRVMDADPIRAGAATSKRRRFQFRLRSVLVFTLICAIPCAWIGRRIKQKQREREAVAAILKDGGDVHFDYQSPSEDDARTGELPRSGPAWMRAILGDTFFSNVVYVHVRTNEGLKRLSEIGRFRELDVRPWSDSLITFSAVEELKDVCNFDVLELGKGQFSDGAIEHLRKTLPFCEIWH